MRHHYSVPLPFSFSFPFPLLISSSFHQIPSLFPMVATPVNPPDLLPDFRAPPPSPAAGAHIDRSFAPENDDFAVFLNRSVRVPELVLPDRIFHRETKPTPWNPPELDFQSLISTQTGGSAAALIKSAAGSVGCFQIVNHGIEKGLIEEVGIAARILFRLPIERKKVVEKSGEREWGFEVEGEFEEEFFWWNRSRRAEEEMAGIWPRGCRDFSDKIECLWREMENMAAKIRLILLTEVPSIADPHSTQSKQVLNGSSLCFNKHSTNNTTHANCQRREHSLNHDILRMLIRSSACSHSLCLHFCRGASRFGVYSKKGWAHFPVKDGMVVVTVGDQIQAMSNGVYKNVIGKPVFQSEEDPISMAFLYSHPTTSSSSCTESNIEGHKTISLTQQVMIAACLTLLYHIVAYIYMI